MPADQRTDADALAGDAERSGSARHRGLVERLDLPIGRAEAG